MADRGRPSRIPRLQDRPGPGKAREVLSKAANLGLTYARRGDDVIHPLESVGLRNPRPGLRRWVAVNTATGRWSGWKESWASIHHDGSVTLATTVGGYPMSSDEYFQGEQVKAAVIECAVADLMALMRVTAAAAGSDEYDLRVGISWTGEQPLTILTKDHLGFDYDGVSTPLHCYTPVEATVNAAESDPDFHWDVHDLAQDCVNQGGISNVLMIQPPAREDQT